MNQDAVLLLSNQSLQVTIIPYEEKGIKYTNEMCFYFLGISGETVKSGTSLHIYLLPSTVPSTTSQQGEVSPFKYIHIKGKQSSRLTSQQMMGSGWWGL